MHKEYEDLISKFYDLSTENKKQEIYNEFNKINDILSAISKFSKEPYSGKLTNYDKNNTDNEDQNLTKIYHNLMIIEEKLIFYLKDSGY